jgi:hypothetical protein
MEFNPLKVQTTHREEMILSFELFRPADIGTIENPYPVWEGEGFAGNRREWLPLNVSFTWARNTPWIPNWVYKSGSVLMYELGWGGKHQMFQLLDKPQNEIVETLQIGRDWPSYLTELFDFYLPKS